MSEGVSAGVCVSEGEEEGKAHMMEGRGERDVFPLR